MKEIERGWAIGRFSVSGFRLLLRGYLKESCGSGLERWRSVEWREFKKDCQTMETRGGKKKGGEEKKDKKEEEARILEREGKRQD